MWCLPKRLPTRLLHSSQTRSAHPTPLSSVQPHKLLRRLQPSWHPQRRWLKRCINQQQSLRMRMPWAPNSAQGSPSRWLSPPPGGSCLSWRRGRHSAAWGGWGTRALLIRERLHGWRRRQRRKLTAACSASRVMFWAPADKRAPLEVEDRRWRGQRVWLGEQLRTDGRPRHLRRRRRGRCRGGGLRWRPQGRCRWAQASHGDSNLYDTRCHALPMCLVSGQAEAL
jgi:hypothetical protein